MLLAKKYQNSPCLSELQPAKVGVFFSRHGVDAAAQSALQMPLSEKGVWRRKLLALY